jgi:DNA-binding transcriptional LysR family regulator
MQDLNDLVYFAEVVDRGGFAAAGRALGLPKSRLSRRVAELEARLGVRLLQRTTRRLSLTAVGEQYHRHCIAMREDAQAAAEAVAQALAEPCGTIRIACPVTLAQTTLAPIFPQFLARYPQVKLDVRVSNRAVDLVEEGFDIALRVRPTLEDSGSLVIKNFGYTRTMLVASTAQLTRQGRPSNLTELQRMDTVNMSSHNGRATWQLVGPDGVTHAFHHHPRFVADDLLSLKYAVLSGIGMCAIPDYMCRDDLLAQHLEELIPGWAPVPGIFHAVFPSRRGLLPAVRKFLDFLGEAVGQNGIAQMLPECPAR